jgi:hypothetical protein
VDDELKRIWKDAVVAYLRYYPEICLQVLRNITIFTLLYFFPVTNGYRTEIVDSKKSAIFWTVTVKSLVEIH